MQIQKIKKIITTLFVINTFCFACTDSKLLNDNNPVANDAVVTEVKESDSGTESSLNNSTSSNTQESVIDSGTNDASQKSPSVITCGASTFKCDLGEKCLSNSDCQSEACRYDGICISDKSCIKHFGGDTCGKGEVEDPFHQHENCCSQIIIENYNDNRYQDNKVYLDKYEITAGRVRAFIEAITAQYGKPDILSWVENHPPRTWNNDWNKFLPSDWNGGTVFISRMLLGDPRHLGETNPGPGVIVPPPTDQFVSVGLNEQFGGQIYVDLHGNNCGTYKGSYGFPTYWYPPDLLISKGEVPRQDATGLNNKILNAQNFLDSKSMNCITGAMLQAFCSWATNGEGELITEEVFNFITQSPSDRPQSISGCGTQYDNHSNLLDGSLIGTVQSGGSCPTANSQFINLTFDAGDYLPFPGSALNNHGYNYPFLGDSNSDKSWQIAAPGRMVADKINAPSGESWMDLAGNLSEQVFDTKSGTFGLRGRGIGYGSSRSDLNVQLMPGETILRVQRPEAKSALSGGRCVRFKPRN